MNKDGQDMAVNYIKCSISDMILQLLPAFAWPKSAYVKGLMSCSLAKSPGTQRKMNETTLFHGTKNT